MYVVRAEVCLEQEGDAQTSLVIERDQYLTCAMERAMGTLELLALGCVDHRCRSGAVSMVALLEVIYVTDRPTA